MEGMQTIDDVEIQEKVESLAGKGTRVLDCEKSSSYQAEEVLLVNGFPVPLNGEEGARIKQALLTGKVPPCELLNEILIRAGILKNPVELETTMNVKSTTKTTELLTLRDKHGVLVDERMKETEEDNEFKSTSTEVWKKEDEDRHLLGLGKQLERITFPSANPSPNGSRHTYSPSATFSSTASDKSDKSSFSTSASSTTSPSASSFSSPRFSVSSPKDTNNTTSHRVKMEPPPRPPPPKIPMTPPPISPRTLISVPSPDSGIHESIENLTESPKSHGRKFKSSTTSPSTRAFFEPTLASLHIEVDGVPVRVSYETFV